MDVSSASAKWALTQLFRAGTLAFDHMIGSASSIKRHRLETADSKILQIDFGFGFAHCRPSPPACRLDTSPSSPAIFSRPITTYIVASAVDG